MDLYNTDQVAELAKINKGTLFHYVKAGAIKPAKRGRRGTNRLYDKNNLVEACMIADLMEMGLPKTRIVSCINGIQPVDRSRIGILSDHDLYAVFNVSEGMCNIVSVSHIAKHVTGKNIIVKLTTNRR